jgi:DNA-binding transcriptional MerR regulator
VAVPSTGETIDTAKTYTIDELAQISGVPARTIRFYQAEEVLPWPDRRGRVAVYGPAHVERLRTIGVMQARGLQLAAIRDLLSLDAPDRLSVWQWLGIQAEANEPLRDTPIDIGPGQLGEYLRPEHLHLLPDLEMAGLIEPRPDGGYRLPLPRLLATTIDFAEVGVQVMTTAKLAGILRRHLTGAAEEILTFLRGQIGDSFSSTDLPDLARTLEVVDQRAPEAVGLLWTEVMREAVNEFQAGLEAAFGTPTHPADDADAPSADA